MSSATSPVAGLQQVAPISGKPLDPPPKDIAGTAAKLESRHWTAGLGYRAVMRFNLANATLLAAGTTYYLFLAVFSLTALAFGIAAVLGADRITELVNSALTEMFPGLVGQTGIDPASLEALGQSTSIIGLVVLLYSGGGAIQAAKIAIHQVYGVGKDPRNFVLSRLILTGWLLVVAPLILLSFAPTVLVNVFTDPIAQRWDLGWVGQLGFGASGLLVALLLDFAILYLILGVLGGVRPQRRPRMLGAALGAVAIEVLKFLAASIIAWSVQSPKYGAFAAPIAALLVLYLQCVILYAAAAVVAGASDQAELGIGMLAAQAAGQDSGDPSQPTVPAPGGEQLHADQPGAPHP